MAGRLVLLAFGLYLLYGVQAGIRERTPVATFGRDPASLLTVVSIVCVVDGPLSNVDIRWRHNGTLYNDNSTGRRMVLNSFMNNTQTTLLINPPSYRDNGTYYCEMRNKSNSTSSWSSARIDLNLLIHLSPGNTNISSSTYSSSTELTCDMGGYVPPNSALRWYRNGVLLSDNSKYMTLYKDGYMKAQKGEIKVSESVLGTLVISSPTVNDSGVYECRVRGYSHLTRSLHLTVQGGASPTPTGGGSNNELLTIIIAAVAGFLGLVVVALIIIIVVVACNRCRRNDVFVHEPTATTVTYLPASKDEETDNNPNEAPPPIPVRTHSQSGRHDSHSGSVRDRDSELPDLLLSRSYNHPPPAPPSQVQYDIPTTESTFPYQDKSEGNPRIIPPDRSQEPPPPPPPVARKPRRTYYDSINMLEKGLPGASGFSLQSVPSPHDVLSGSLQREGTQNPMDFIYQDGFTPEDLAPYDTTVENDYDQIYSEPIEPAMMNANTNEVNEEGLPYSAIYDDPKPLGTTEAPLQVTDKNIIEIRKLGNGQFGQVILARTRNLSLVDLKLSETATDRSQSILVAVKKLKTHAETGLFEAFDKEVKFMSRLNHDNVVRLLSVCMVGEHFIMMEYMENGDLNQFLQKHTLVPDTVTGLGDWEITPIILLYIGVQVSSGMHYLGSRKFVHRDLATRNCLVGKDFVVKISDFGMSRRLYESAYYRVQGTLVLPIRWMACETFYGKFSVKSDTWAFGVTLWEVYTLAQSDPYDEMTDEEVIQDSIRGANRKLLPIPDACPREAYDVMLRCWVHDPAMRADFDVTESFGSSTTFYMYTTNDQAPPTTTPTPTTGPTLLTNGSLLFIFVLIAIVLAFLIAVALIILFCICFCNGKKPNNGETTNGETSSLKGQDEGHYDVIHDVHVNIEPQELSSYGHCLPDTMYSTLPLPIHVSPRNSVILELAHLSPLFRNYEEPRPIMEAPCKPVNNGGSPNGCHGNQFSFNPYGDEVELGEGPPLPPPRSRLRSSLPPLPTTEVDPTLYDHIYTEVLEPSMFDTNPAPSPRQPSPSPTHTHGSVPSPHKALPYAPIYDVSGGILTRQLFHISSKCVQIIEDLGHGHFGKIFLAATINVSFKDLQLTEDRDRKRSILVAVKQLSSHASPELKEAFHHEMKFMSQLLHANVVRLLAVNMSTTTPFIMIEYMENGDLNEFLKKQELQPGSVYMLGINQITSVVLMYISVQIASGMRYLANKKFIHRDLAARNCLVGREFVTKISDFGMSHNFYESSYHRVADQLILPIRWMATETYYGRFSVKSDSWAFGVTIWEVFTLCRSLPYSHLRDDEVVADAIKGEDRELLPKPTDCPNEVYAILGRCFVHSPLVRADFEEIYSRLFVAYMKLAEKLR